jgi:hypothetical protein
MLFILNKDRKKNKDLDSNLNMPLFDMLFPCLPEKIKVFFRFGYKYSENAVVENVNSLIFVFKKNFKSQRNYDFIKFLFKKDFEANSVEELSVKNLEPKII